MYVMLIVAGLLTLVAAVLAVRWRGTDSFRWEMLAIGTLWLMVGTAGVVVGPPGSGRWQGIGGSTPLALIAGAMSPGLLAGAVAGSLVVGQPSAAARLAASAAARHAKAETELAVDLKVYEALSSRVGNPAGLLQPGTLHCGNARAGTVTCRLPYTLGVSDHRVATVTLAGPCTTEADSCQVVALKP
ncbi:MAG TPA: hypothetical protein VFP61_02610 [Acidimicrobiales bacterium]|nr:hypothetical protein [Acidimicrobiales bacterium]